jgi:hypothetical protein
VAQLRVVTTALPQTKAPYHELMRSPRIRTEPHELRLGGLHCDGYTRCILSSAVQHLQRVRRTSPKRDSCENRDSDECLPFMRERATQAVNVLSTFRGAMEGQCP